MVEVVTKVRSGSAFKTALGGAWGVRRAGRSWGESFVKLREEIGEGGARAKVARGKW